MHISTCSRFLEMALIFTVVTLSLSGQTDKKPIDNSTEQTIITVPYRIFPTQNMWTFIKLDTRNGKMWQVQYSMKSEGRFVTYLNLIALVTKEEEANDRFTLYPSQNIYTFILLDQIEGKTWQVQWWQKVFVSPACVAQSSKEIANFL